MPDPAVLIQWQTRDGEEHEERWPSSERFRAWVALEPGITTWTAYTEDEDGEWIVIDQAR